MKYSPWLSLFPVATLGCLIPLTVKAQVTTDGTTSTTVNQDGNNFTIEQGDRIGDNLFHSFNEFSVPTGGSAAFNNLDSIANIFSRVTGINPSNIDGVISANGAANLFLINPNGIIFEENARLDLGGSFFASTADSLLFEGDAEFSAVNPQAPPLLEVSIPIGARFRDNPGDIVNRSFAQNIAGDFVGLEVLAGNNLSFVGGNINFEVGMATARGGNIELGGLSEAGTVGIKEDGSLSFPEDLAKANITLTNAADIDARGAGGGNITINAQNLDLTTGEFGGSSIRAGITSDSTSAEAQAGDIAINVSENITLDESRIANQVAPEGVGNSGNITITTGSLKAINGGDIAADTFGKGNAGAVEITATEDLSFDGETSEGIRRSGVTSLVTSEAVGDAGGITISTNNLTLTNGGIIDASTSGQGNAGLVDITATGNLTFGQRNAGFQSGVTSQVASSGVGNSGGVSISTTNLNLTNGGVVDASTSGQGNAGLVDINATGELTFDGEGLEGIPSGVTSLVGSSGVGNAGGVSISTNNLTLTNGGRVATDSFGEGDAGGVTISTNNLTLTNGGQITASIFGQGNAGLVDIAAKGDLTFDGETSEGFNSGITSQVAEDAVGNAGGVSISTNNLTLTNGGRVDSSTFGQGDAGAVAIIATGNLSFNGEDSEGFNSGVTSQVGLKAVGDAGGVTISTGNLTLINGGGVSADTFGEGNSGAIEISATGDLTFEGETLGGIPSGVTSGVSLEAVGDAGGVTITTGSLTLTNGGEIDASTFGIGNAGLVKITASDTITFNGKDSRGFGSGVTSRVEPNAEGDAGGVTITTGSLTLTNGGQISASTLGQGNAGIVTVNARESINISGVSENNLSGGIFASAETVNGIAGDVNVLTKQLTIDDGGRISVSSPEGLAGNLNITANSLSQNRGAIASETGLSEGDVGANINLEISDIWNIENESIVSATAFGDADGGNININQGLSGTEFLLFAFPPTGANGSDIIANAEQGNGGRIDITAAGVFGIEFRDIPPEEAQSNSLNDFSVSSQFGTSGETIINRTVEDPTSGLINLPEAVGDATDQISQNPCEQGVGSEFTITGKGGLPPNVNESLNSESAQVGLIETVLSQQQKVAANNIPSDNSIPEAVPAMGWVFNDKGEVTLTAYSNTDTEITRSGQQRRSTCKSGLSD